MMKNTNEHEKNGKKERVAWSEELHRKFIVAVNHLGGIDKAAPKKIMALMKDEKLTKENVASHLQKYRLHLKKVSTTFVPNQEGSIQFHAINAAAVVQNVSIAPSDGVFGPNSTSNGKRDINFCEWGHGNRIMALTEENSSLMEEHRGYLGNEQHKSQSTFMANNLGLIRDLVTSSSSCNSQELTEIAELRHEMAAIRHENHQLREVVEAMKAQQDMLMQAILQRTIVPRR
ncbi:hypothetical protein TanjilG_01237 [Lupinus angustifolius]|uniref:HTH myb-type domain-containing protein n=1 Tax=Lupinus angustifolius TaxID=3871 RepID=A0A4P1REN1_LUPAN|nr:PREDICTED: putative two-component response regulator ARR19 [Lupinus angustifolius]OIW09266.1 hypothetical protein TanjilG_01237 [Lupinus angustifolius]